MHIFLTGRIQVGKSTLIRRVLRRFPGIKVGGFKTVTVPDTEGTIGSVHIFPGASAAARGDDGTRVGIRWGEGRIDAFPEVFEALGVRLLQEDPGDMILMDEIGLMESEAAEFSRRILEKLNDSIPVVGVIKPQPSPLLDAIRAHPSVEVITVTDENRDALVPVVERKLRAILGEAWAVPEPEPDSCGAVVLEDTGEERRVLLISMGSGRWSFPKGHKEAGESDEETALREVLEETGITCSLIPGFKMTVPSARPGDDRNIVFFLGRSTGGKLEPLLSELTGAGWFPVSQAEKMIAFPQDREVFRRALAFAKAL